MRKRVLVLLSAAAFGVGAAAPVALAQDTGEAATEEDDSGTDYGWIGLLGLAGLAGLAGRKRDNHVDRDRDRGTVR